MAEGMEYPFVLGITTAQPSPLGISMYDFDRVSKKNWCCNFFLFLTIVIQRFFPFRPKFISGFDKFC